MDIVWECLKSVLLGIVQGITEWLPISSTAHLKLLQNFLPLLPEDGLGTAFSSMYDVVIQLGSILAVLLLYFHTLNPLSPKKTAAEKRGTWKLWGKVLIASIPAAVAGLLIDDWLDELEAAHTTVFLCIIAGALIVYGVLFIWLESRAHTTRVGDLSAMRPTTALGIGLFQMLALIPGTSRSGSTILGATILGCARPVAAEFSFFMAIPVMFGASGLKLLKAAADGSLAAFSWQHWLTLAVGFVTAFFVSLVVIRALMNFIRKHSFKPFGYYRIVLGAAVLVYALCA